MKRYLLSIFALLGIITIQAQNSWDFNSVSSTDQTNLNADTDGWTYDSSNKRWSNNSIYTNEPLTANQVELAFTQGLLFTTTLGTGNTTAENYIRIDTKKGCLTLNNKLAKVTIPNVKAGQIITIECQSSSGTTARKVTATNVTPTSGFEESTSKTTNVGTIDADGTVVLQSTGGMYVYSISVKDPTTGGGGDTPSGSNDIINNNVPLNTQKNQLNVKVQDGSIYYYNTEDLASVDINDNIIKVNKYGATTADEFNGSVASLSFSKKSELGDEGNYSNTDSKVVITESKGWLESAYIKWDLFEGATSYNVYVKGGQYSDYTQIDDQLVRNYGTYGRADVVGLKAADNYQIKVVPVDESKAEMTAAANEATGIIVKNYSRQGFAFMNGYAPGAYNSDGTLKSGGKVFYVTKNTAKTIKTTVKTGPNDTNMTEVTGFQAIIDAYQKGYDTTPIAFRFIGLIEKDDLDAISSSEEGIQIKGKNKDSELNITIEGIGDDATVKGFGFLVRNAKGVEFRNIGIIRCMDDGISLDTDNSNIWIHHTDVFYGKSGSGDHAKGDGATDVKSDSKYVTVSYNRYWDTGKTNMFGMKSESGPNYISYDHNWFDHSDSRHPRIRTMSVHVWNNYFDNVAKYGVGATSGSSVFVENNYFLKTKKPILSSLQGTDALGSGTFSGEDGGMIKAYGNYFDRTTKNFSYYTQNNPASTGYDAYETTSRSGQIPSTEVTRAGGTSYNNFDTNSSLMYSYEAVAAEEVPALVTGFYGAGRLNHGDISYTFTDNVGNDDTDSKVDSGLASLIDNYKSSLVGIFGDENASSGETGGEGGNNSGEGGNGSSDETPAGTILASFDGSPSHSMFTAANNYGDGKITYEGTYYKKGQKLDTKGSITFTPTQDYTMTIILATVKPGRDVKINGTTTTVSGTENTEEAYYEMQSISITGGTQYTITKGSAESIVMLIKLVPVSE